MIKSAIEKIRDEAYLEASLGDKKTRKYPVKRGEEAKRNQAKTMPVSAFLNKVVDLSERPVMPDPFTGMLPRTVRTTNGFYTITYNPEGSPKRVYGKPFTFGQDMIRGRFCVSGAKHLRALAGRIPEFAFLLKWSYFTEGLFAMAKKHPGIPFPFNFKWAEYGDMIEKKAEAMGIDIDHKPYFVYITKKDKLAELREKYKMIPNPDREQYQPVLDEVDKEENVYGKNNPNDN